MLAEIAELKREVEGCLSRDKGRILRMLKRAEELTRSKKPADRLVGLSRNEINRSKAARGARRGGLPATITYPPELPVSQKKQEIAEAISKHQVVILCGETGSGKTTQLPKICLELGRGVDGMIGHTQPRRIAARSVANRIAEELFTTVGKGVGYKVRFTDHVSQETVIKLMTDGILLAEIQGDPTLRAYDTLIIDEAHERSLNIDFLLGYIKRLLPKRPDLKVIITSATIDPERFSRHFNKAPILMVSGRTYPVETRYRPILGDTPDELDLGFPDALLHAVDELCGMGRGDILIFLSGERDIRMSAQLLRKSRPGIGEIVPLYARLSADEQMKVFKPHQGRRIVLSTNVAETSLTVPGIRYVIDPGYARISRYSSRNKVQRLQIERVSQASADQRKGRCGRVEAGVCIRMYSEEDFANRAQYTDPEILRTHLAGVILRMKALGLGDIGEFPFVEPPDYRAIRDGFQTLHELGAIDDRNELTDIGRSLSRLPIDPRVGRMIIAGEEEHCLKEMLIIASALSVQDPRERPMDQAELADVAHAQFKDEMSDFLGFLKLWDWFQENSIKLSTNQMRKLCQKNFVSFVRMREWRDIHHQLLELGEWG